jgi:hypothetical protein
LSDEEIFSLSLIEIEIHLQKNRKSLKDCVGMPYANGYVAEQLGNRFIYESVLMIIMSNFKNSMAYTEVSQVCIFYYDDYVRSNFFYFIKESC